MEREPSREQMPNPSIDLLDARVRYSFSIEREAAEHLPQISEAENKTSKERFVVLLGESALSGRVVRVSIKGVYEETDEDRQIGVGTYREGVEHVEINVPAMKRQIQSIQQAGEEYKDFGFIGHLHTHPGIPPEGMSALAPSEGDMRSFAESLASGELSASEPFVFGIAAPDHTGETNYAFYRLLQREDGSLDYEFIDQS